VRASSGVGAKYTPLSTLRQGFYPCEAVKLRDVPKSTTKFANEQSFDNSETGSQGVVLLGIGGLVFRYLSSSKRTQALSQPKRPQ